MAMKGSRRHINRLKALSGSPMERAVGTVLFEGGELIRVEAQLLISRNSASGHAGGKHQHIPSKPGEPPNNDTGVLAGNIETNQISTLVVEVSSNATYSRPLEFGTSKMAARPFMHPARDAKRKEIVAMCEKAVEVLSKQAGK